MLIGLLKNLSGHKRETEQNSVAALAKNKAASVEGPVRYNMGCGYNKPAGFINIDAFEECAPDLVIDLEQLPWPLETSSADFVQFNHSLEHMGQSSTVFLGIMKELYRICKPGAEITINVPHPRHDNFINDPTHVRVITPTLLALFDKEINDYWRENHFSNSQFAYYLDVNFKVDEAKSTYAEPYLTMFRENKISKEELKQLEQERNNVVEEYRIKMIAIK